MGKTVTSTHNEENTVQMIQKKVLQGLEVPLDVSLIFYPESTFSYATAPPRGSQEGVRDFTARRTYKKWHKFKKNDRYGTQ